MIRVARDSSVGATDLGAVGRKRELYPAGAISVFLDTRASPNESQKHRWHIYFDSMEMGPSHWEHFASARINISPRIRPQEDGGCARGRRDIGKRCGVTQDERETVQGPRAIMVGVPSTIGRNFNGSFRPILAAHTGAPSKAPEQLAASSTRSEARARKRRLSTK